VHLLTEKPLAVTGTDTDQVVTTSQPHDEDLEGTAIEIRQFQKEAFAGGRAHAPVDIEPREGVLDYAHRLDAVHGASASTDRQ
jgi:hypothetical protein